MKIEVLDLSSVGTGWSLSDLSQSEKNKFKKEGNYFIFKSGKKFIDFVEEISAVQMQEFEEFGSVDEAVEYLSDLNYDITVK